MASDSSYTHKLTGIFALLLGLFTTFVYAQDTAPSGILMLESSRRHYHEKVAALTEEVETSWNNLNTNYTVFLQGLDKASREKGDLDALLAIRAEVTRFGRQKNVSGDNVVLFPPALTEAQRHYLTKAAKIREDQAQYMSNLTQAYLADLDVMKRNLTKQGKIDGAIEVNDEIKRIKNAQPPPVPDKAGSGEATDSSGGDDGVLPFPNFKPLRDHVCVFVTQNGFPIKDLTLLAIGGSNATKIVEYHSDLAGRIDFRADDLRETFRILLINDRYAVREIKAAKAGEAYQIKIAGAPPGSGVMLVKDTTKVITLPVAGRLDVQTWSGGQGGSETGPALMGKRPVFHLQQQNSQVMPFVFAHYETPFYMIDEDKKYEVTLHQLAPGLNFYLRYTTLK